MTEKEEIFERGRKAGIEEYEEWLVMGFDKTLRLNEVDKKDAPKHLQALHEMIENVTKLNIEYVKMIAKQMLEGELPRIPRGDK